MTYSQKANPNATNSEMDSKQIIKHPKLTSIQHNEISERFAELVVDGMDMKSLVSYVIDDLTEYYEKCDQHELRELVDEYDEELWDEMVDDVTNETVLDTNNTGGKY
tara:strand:- start:1090 stop:1410 length:321 start_codon:yes stop_codon:yes gene_type:complete